MGTLLQATTNHTPQNQQTICSIVSLSSFAEHLYTAENVEHTISASDLPSCGGSFSSYAQFRDTTTQSRAKKSAEKIFQQQRRGGWISWRSWRLRYILFPQPVGVPWTPTKSGQP